jgi:hypothetical protein
MRAHADRLLPLGVQAGLPKRIDLERARTAMNRLDQRLGRGAFRRVEADANGPPGSG